MLSTAFYKEVRLTRSAVLGMSGCDFFPFYPTHSKIHYKMIKPILGKVMKYEMKGSYFNRVTRRLRAASVKVTQDKGCECFE